MPVCILLNVVTHPADVSVDLALLVLHHDLVLVPRAARLGNLLLLFFFGLFIFLELLKVFSRFSVEVSVGELHPLVTFDWFHS